MTKLLQYLNKWYNKDNLTRAYDSWSDFDTFQMNDSIESYILEFDKKHKKISKHGIVILDSVTAFKLLDCAGLSHRDKQLALTAVDYSKPDIMFQQMIQALKKFFRIKVVPSSSGAQGSFGTNSVDAEVNLTR